MDRPHSCQRTPGIHSAVRLLTQGFLWKIGLQFLPIIKIDCVWLCAYDLNVLVLVSAALVAVKGTQGTMAEIALTDEQGVDQVTGKCHHIPSLSPAVAPSAGQMLINGNNLSGGHHNGGGCSPGLLRRDWKP